MKFMLLVEGDLDDDALKVTIVMGKKALEGELRHEGHVTKCVGLHKILPYEDEGLQEGMEALSSGLMEFFSTLQGNV